MNKTTSTVAGLAAVLAAIQTAWAADNGTNAVSAALMWPSWDEPNGMEPGGGSLWSKYEDSFSRRSQSIFADKFYSAGAMLNIASTEPDIVPMGRGGMESAMKDALRETFVGALPRERWADYGRSELGTFLGNFLAGSLGNTAEEDSKPVSPVLSYSTVEARQSAVEQAKRDGHVQYGIRLWDTYAYTTVVFGHIRGQPAVLSLRLKSSTDLGSLGQPIIEGNLSFVLFDDCHLVIGGSLRPAEFDSRTYGHTMSVSLQHATGIGELSWYAGFGIGPDDRSSCSFGISMPW